CRRRGGEGIVARAAPSPDGRRPADEAPRDRRRLSLPGRVRGLRCRPQAPPDELADKRSSLPTDQGYEATIAARQAGRAEAREAAKRTGKTPRSKQPSPEVGRSDLMRTREASPKKLAD